MEKKGNITYITESHVVFTICIRGRGGGGGTFIVKSMALKNCLENPVSKNILYFLTFSIYTEQLAMIGK